MDKETFGSITLALWATRETLSPDRFDLFDTCFQCWVDSGGNIAVFLSSMSPNFQAGFRLGFLQGSPLGVPGDV